MQEDFLSSLKYVRIDNALNKQYRDNIKNTLPPKTFTSLAAAKEFIETTSLFNPNNRNWVAQRIGANTLFGPTLPDPDNPCDNGHVRIKNDIVFAAYNVEFDYFNITTGRGSVSNMVSYISGLTIAVSWTQLSASYSIGSNQVISFTVIGLQNYNVFAEDIGTIFVQRVMIKGTYNPCTGALTLKVS